MRRADICSEYGISRSTLYRLLTAGEFPRPVRITSRLQLWRRTDVEKWAKQLPTEE
ncbi:helix-turn-helix transcriptional regulator [Myxococcota bacterium]